MGYITYKPIRTDPPLVTLQPYEDETEGTLTIARITHCEPEMRDYWGMDSQAWYWFAIDGGHNAGLPMPAAVLNALRDIVGTYISYEQRIPSIDLTHAHGDLVITYRFQHNPLDTRPGKALYLPLSIYADAVEYDPAVMLPDKRPYFGDVDFAIDTLYNAIEQVKF